MSDQNEPNKTEAIKVEDRAYATTPDPAKELPVEKTFVQPKDDVVMKDGEKLQFPPGVGEGKIAGEGKDVK